MLIEMCFGIIEVGLAPNLAPDLTLSNALLLQPSQFSFPLSAGSVDVRRQIVGRKHPVVEIVLHAANHELGSRHQLAEQAFDHRLENRNTCSTADRDRGAAHAGPEQAQPRTARRAAAAGSPWSYRRSRSRSPSNPSTAGLPAC